MEIKTETVEKYLNALRDLKKVLKYNNKLSLSGFCSDYGLSKNCSLLITKGGLVKNIGNKGKGALYSWSTIESNINMAKELINRCNKISSAGMKQTRERITVNDVKQNISVNSDDKQRVKPTQTPTPKTPIKYGISIFGVQILTIKQL